MKKFIWYFCLPLLVIGYFFYWQYSSALAGFEGGKKVPLNIEYGTSTKTIISILEEKELITKSWPVLMYLKLHEDIKLQAGDFILVQGTPVPELLKTMSSGQQLEIPLRVIEGSTIEEIDLLLTQKGVIKNGDFIRCAENCQFPEFNFVNNGNLEGFLFPDTYFISTEQFDSRELILRMLKNFEKRFLSEENLQQMKSLQRTLSEVVIMASIIEKEEWQSQNRPTISGILWKRLDEGIPLGADATTRYYEGLKSSTLTREHFEKDNPYNTRRKQGLPPTAIGSPGTDALFASIHPEKTQYYYYLHDSSGKIHYAVTNEEHNRNKEKYIW